MNQIKDELTPPPELPGSRCISCGMEFTEHEASKVFCPECTKELNGAGVTEE